MIELKKKGGGERKNKAYLFIAERVDSAVEKNRLADGDSDVTGYVLLELRPVARIFRTR